MTVDPRNQLFCDKRKFKQLYNYSVGNNFILASFSPFLVPQMHFNYKLVCMQESCESPRITHFNEKAFPILFEILFDRNSNVSFRKEMEHSLDYIIIAFILTLNFPYLLFFYRNGKRYWMFYYVYKPLHFRKTRMNNIFFVYCIIDVNFTVT